MSSQPLAVLSKNQWPVFKRFASQLNHLAADLGAPSLSNFKSLDLAAQCLGYANGSTLKNRLAGGEPGQVSFLTPDGLSEFCSRYGDKMAGSADTLSFYTLPRKAYALALGREAVIGGSGSGKSFLINARIDELLRQSVPVLVVDTGLSYKHLTKRIKGDHRFFTPHTDDDFTSLELGTGLNVIELEEYRMDCDSEDKRAFLQVVIKRFMLGLETPPVAFIDESWTTPVSMQLFEGYGNSLTLVGQHLKDFGSINAEDFGVISALSMSRTSADYLNARIPGYSLERVPHPEFVSVKTDAGWDRWDRHDLAPLDSYRSGETTYLEWTKDNDWRVREQQVSVGQFAVFSTRPDDKRRALLTHVIAEEGDGTRWVNA